MARWAGWGAGPAGAGSAGGPTPTFLAIVLVATLVMTGVLAWKGSWPGAAATAVAAVYFGMRLFGGLGRDDG